MDQIFKTIIRQPLITILLVIISSYASAWGQFQSIQDDPNEPWHIVADEVSYDDKANQYIATGNVSIIKMDKKLSADFVRFDQKAMTAFAEGHVIMTAGEDVLTGSRMEMNLDAETGTIYNGTIFLKENHFYIKGDKIQKVGEYSYAVDKASISTCDGDQPAWKITGRNLNVTVEGYGTVRHAALWAKKVPVLYTPYLVFPVKLKRQTGLLAPQIGYSDRKGGIYIQPLFWAINDSSDATFYWHHMGRRGEKLGLEYRYVLDEMSKGTLMYDYLNDRKVDDGSPDSSKDWGYVDEGLDILRPNSNRYWLRMKKDQALSYGFSAKLDIDIVSDQDYLREFKSGYTGFEETEENYVKNFGRGLDDFNDPIRSNRLNLNRNWFLYSLNAELRWYDNVINRRQENADTTLQYLPIVEFNGVKQKIFKTPFYFDFDSEYTYLYQEDGPRAHRMDAYPKLYLPFRFKHYFTIEPSVGARGTAWYFARDEYRSSDQQTLYRGIYDLKIDLSSEIYSVFQGIGNTVDQIKHAIRPQIIYEYTPEEDQDEYPLFDDLDRIERQSRIVYSITNTFTSKTIEKMGKKEGIIGDNAIETLPNTYNQFCRFKLEQSYDFNKAEEDDPEPFSPIYGELKLAPGRYFSVDADAEWSHYDSDFRSHNVAITLWDRRGDRLFVEHRYERDTSESIYSDILLKVSGGLSLYANYERNILDKKNIETGLGLLYKAQCWSIEARYTKEGDDHKYRFNISLYGI